MRILHISLAAAGALALGGCDYGNGYGGYDVGLGYGSPYYGGYSGGYYEPYYGWYGDYYYPGTGIYVYDTYRRPYAMTETQRTYWTQRQPRMRTSTTTTAGARVAARENWSGFNRRPRRGQ